MTLHRHPNWSTPHLVMLVFQNSGAPSSGTGVKVRFFLSSEIPQFWILHLQGVTRRRPWGKVFERWQNFDVDVAIGFTNLCIMSSKWELAVWIQTFRPLMSWIPFILAQRGSMGIYQRSYEWPNLSYPNDVHYCSLVRVLNRIHFILSITDDNASEIWGTGAFEDRFRVTTPPGTWHILKEFATKNRGWGEEMEKTRRKNWNIWWWLSSRHTQL